MAEIRISDMTMATSANETDLLEIAQVDGNSSSGYATKKTTILAIATKILKGISFSDLATTSKQIIAAINELKNNKIESSDKGTAGGVAELDSNGHVPASQLPSSVDDIVEGYYYDGKFYEEDTHTTEIPAEAGKIYIDLESNNTYRWGGSVYVEISPSLSLGETSTTAYRGDRGKTAYDHATEVGRETTAKTLGLYKFSVTSEGHVGASPVPAQKSDFTALGLLGDIDNALSSTSENPVKNNALYSAFQDKANTTGTYAGLTSGKAQTVQVPVPSSVGTKSNPYMIRQIPFNTAEAETMSLVGATVNANQLLQNGNFVTTSGWTAYRGTLTADNNKGVFVGEGRTNASIYRTINFTANHKYLVRLKIASTTATTQTRARMYKQNVGNLYLKGVALTANTSYLYEDFFVPSNDLNNFGFYIYPDNSAEYAGTATIENVQIIDLTAYFGSTEIPDKTYTMEQTESGSGIAWLKSQGFFTEDYIGYRANGLASVNVSEKINVGKNQWNGKYVNSNYSEYETWNSSTSYGNMAGNNAMPIIVGKQYTFSVDGESQQIRYAFLDADKNRIGSLTNATTTTAAPSNAVYLQWRQYSSQESEPIKSQLEIGSTATPYEPYTETHISFDTTKTIRGRYDLDADNNIIAIGDEYNADGSCKNKYNNGIDLGSLTWTLQTLDRWESEQVSGIKTHERSEAFDGVSENYISVSIYNLNADTSLLGIAFYNKKFYIRNGSTTTEPSGNVICALETPTTDTAAPFTANQVIDGAGTEEFTDYGVTSGSRDFAVPPGNVSNYYAYTDGSMVIPAIPPADGDYDMKLHVSGGVRTFTWE